MKVCRHLAPPLDARPVLLRLLVEEDGERQHGGALVQAGGEVLPGLVQPRGDAPDVRRGVVAALDQLGRVRQDTVDVGKHVLEKIKKVFLKKSF